MTSKQNVDLVQKALAALLESEGENKWITINGTHVQVDGKGSIVSGPANLKSWDAKPKWEAKESPQEKGTAKDWNAKPSWGGPSAPPPIAQANDQKAEAKAESPIAQAKDQIKAPAQDVGKIGGKGRELEAPRISYMNPHDIAAQKDVKQFKEGANALTGEVEPLEGHYDHRGSGPIQVWQRNDGTHEVISGRHRLAHAKRNGVTEIPVQVYKESEGFTQEHALGMDAELNIRDGNGSVADYARHFANNPHITEEDARKKGLLGRAKGQSGWTIGRHGTEQLRAAHQGKKIKDSHAETIARIAPGDADIQRAGMTMAAEGKTGEHIENTLMSMKAQAFASGMSQADMFGNNDSAIKEMEETATKAGQIRRAINNQIHAVKGAANRPEEAKALGVDVSNPEEIKAKVKDLEAQAERWKNWAVHPDLAAQAFGRDMTPQAQAIAQAQAEGPQAPPPVESGVDMFGNPTGKPKPEMMTDLFGSQVTVDAEKQPEAPKAEDPSAWMDKPADLKKDGTGEMFGGLFSPDRQIPSEPSEPSEPPRISQGIDEVPSSGVSKADIRNGASGDQFHEIGSDNKKAGMDNVNEGPKANPDYRPPAGFVAPSNQDELHQRMTQAMDDHELHSGSVDKYLAAQTGKLKKNADGYHVATDPVTGQESILSKDESTAKAMQSALFATRSRAAGDKRDSAKADNHNLHQFVNAHDGKPFGDGDQTEGVRPLADTGTGPIAPPTVSGTSPAAPGRKRAALTKADQGTIQAEVDRLGHEMSQLKKSDPQYRILYKRRQHTLAKLSPTGSGGAGANSSATTPTPSGPAPAGPSAPPAITPEREDELAKSWAKRVAQVNKAADTPTVNKRAEKLKAEAEGEARQIAARAGELEQETRAKGYGDLADKAKAVGERAQAQGQGQAPENSQELDGYLKRVEDNRRRNNAAITDPSKINAQRFAMRLADVHKGLENGHPDAPKAAANWLSQAQTWAADKSDWGKDNPEDHKAVTDQIAKVKAKLGQGETIGGKPVQGNTAGDEYLQRTKASFDNEVAQSAKDRGRNTPNHTMVSNGILARHMDDLTNGVNRFHLLDHVRDNHPDLYDHLRNPDNRKYWSNHKNQLEMHLEDNPVKSAQAGPSAPPAMPAQAKPQRKAPEAIDGSQYFGPDGKLDTKTLGDHITKAGGTWDTDSAIARAYRPMRAALKAAPDVRTSYEVLDHIMGTQPALYNHAKQDAKYGNLPHHILIGNHYQLRNGVPLKRTNGQTVGNLPSKAYDRPVTPGEIRTEPGSKNQTQFQKSLGVLSERINGHGSFYKKNWELMQMLSRGWPKDEVLDHVRDNHPDLYEGLRNDVTPGPGRGYPLTYDTQIETVRNHLAKNAQKGTQESFRPKITRLVDWLTQE